MPSYHGQACKSQKKSASVVDRMPATLEVSLGELAFIGSCGLAQAFLEADEGAPADKAGTVHLSAVRAGDAGIDMENGWRFTVT